MNAKATMPTPTVQPASERRRSERKSNVGKAQISSPTATSSEDRLTASGVNISRHGVCFSLEKPIPEDAFYLIDVMMGTQKMNAEIQIITCRKNGDRYDIGAEFC